MKKFTITLLAAFVAVVSWAGTPSDRQVRKAPLQLSSLNGVRQMVPGKKVATMQLQAPAENPLAAKAKALSKTGAKKAPKKAGIADLLSREWMLCSQYLDYDEEKNELVELIPAAGGTPVSFSIVDNETIAIEGFISGASEKVNATFAMTTDQEKLAAGIIAEVSIADGQKLLESETYGPIYLKNCSDKDAPLTAYVYSAGFVQFNDLWAAVLGGEGEYAGMPFTPYCQSVAVPVNGKMAWGTGESATEIPVFIDQDAENAKNATVYNLGGYETAVDVTMKEDKSFVIYEQPMFYYNDTYGYVYLTGIDNNYLATITGQGNESSLTFDGQWALYLSDGSKLYVYDDIKAPATITMTEGEFAYPVIADVAATPADPEILAIGNYDAIDGYGSVAFIIPTTDVAGNDLKEEKLFYQLYSDIAGDIQPIVFTPALYTKLTEDMSIIPYTFTDNYDFVDKGSYKIVFLNYNFSASYDRIGVKSIYTGGGETNASEIVWEAIEKEEPVSAGGEFTFDFNALGEDWPCSSSTTHDGDITQAKELTEGDVTLTISPKVESAQYPNRFWGTKNGPQLRVYSGTLTFTANGTEPITKIDFTNNAKWDSGNTADSGELVDAVWTGEAKKVIITIAGNTQLNSIVVTTGSGAVELVTLPEGVEAEDYTLAITQYAYSSQAEDWVSIDSEETVQVAFDGSDVYVSGLAYWFKENFVKGQLNAEGQVVFKSGQLVGEDEYGKEYIVATFGEDETIVDYVFDYDAETRTLTLVEGYYLFETDSPTSTDAYTYATEAIYTPGAYVLPEVVTLPEGAEAETWYLSAIDESNSAVNDEVKVAFVENDIYVQGLCTYLPEAWVKGTISGQTATFASGQFYGTYDEEYNLFFAAADSEYNSLENATFAYDAENGKLTTTDIIVLAGNARASKAYNYFYDTEISREKGDGFPVEAPEGLQTETYLFTAMETVAVEEETEWARRAFKAEGEEAKTEKQPYSYQTQVGFDGNTVYFKGFSNETAEFWAKGTLSEDGKTVTIPANQYIGQLDYYGLFTFDYYITAVAEDGETMEDIVLSYDAANNKFTTTQTLALNGSKTELYYYQLFDDVEITKMQEFAATPADPEVISFNGITKYPNVKLNVPATDVDGNPLLTAKLFYTLWVEKDGKQEQLVFTTEDYELEADMTEIPYTYDDSYDIYAGGSTVFLNMDAEEILNWTKIGVQSIYTGAGETNKSNIGWMDLVAYWQTVGISDMTVAADKAATVIFDLQGRRVANPGKGLYIVNGKKVVMK